MDSKNRLLVKSIEIIATTFFDVETDQRQNFPMNVVLLDRFAIAVTHIFTIGM